MSATRQIHGKTAFLIFLMVVFGSSGDTLMGKGMRAVGPPQAWSVVPVFEFLQRAAASPVVWAGFGCLLLFFLSYMLVLTWADFSFVLPASAAAYAVVPLLGHFFLGEAVGPVRWTGVALITLGVALVGNTPPRTTLAAPAAPVSEPARGD
ncbi:MAG TPA: EamA family transporter [Patescibacteria group bacterium]|nr:EamA family transporter [Patescibacteria group bacterium]